MGLFIEKITTVEGSEVKLYRVTMASGFSVSVLNWGATLVEILLPDQEREGGYDNILVGYKDMRKYIENPFYMGSTVGRTAGRIGNAKWKSFECRGIDACKSEVRACLTANSGEHHIHGGKRGFSHRLWQTLVEKSSENENFGGTYTLEMSLQSPDGEEGYPGNVQAKVVYKIHNEGRLEIEYSAVTDQDTLVNLTNHAYFNLSGGLGESIENHELMLDSDTVLELGDGFVPTGVVKGVDQTPFDFRLSTPIGARIHEKHPQLLLAGGYDHPWILNVPKGKNPQAILSCPLKGRTMAVWTNQPCAVVYSMNFDSEEIMVSGKPARARSAVCLEFQNPPIASDGRFAETSVLLRGQTYSRVITFAFGVSGMPQ